MNVAGYQCQTCWATFREEYSCDPSKEDQPKCPTCQSANVKKVDLPESWMDRGSGLRFG